MLPHFPSRGVQPLSAPADPIIRILVADPHPVVRAGLKTMTDAKSDIRVIGEAAYGPDVLRLSTELNPDIVLLEVSLPGLDGAQVTARLRECRPDQKVMVLTGCDDAGSLRLLLGMGVQGYVLKRATAEELMGAIRAVAAGGTHIDLSIAVKLAGAQGTGDEQAAELSERERDVVRLMALGYSNKEIAARLKLSVKTIETYKTRALEKLEMRSRVDIVRFAARRGWLKDTNTTNQPPPLVATESRRS